ncbi:MAG: dihydropteroate synthase [Bacteroidia bacterium]|nr:dihydropteroate synthase [Bacteroidia bacterium]
MGILNVTPDSFYDGGMYKQDSDILNKVEKMIIEGATFIDIGAYSSRPDADHISEEEELKRILPVINLVLNKFPDIIISADTFRSNVARKCIEAGAAIINDISAGNLDSNLLKTIAKLQVPFIMMHMKGKPQTMKNFADYKDLLKEVLLYFSERIVAARKLGIIDLIVDPGFGFSKSIDQNFELLNKLEHLQITDLPVLVGISRKSMIYKTLRSSPNEALNGTSVLNTIALQKGASILRVHDVKEAMECIKLTSQLK